jgi:hypothetical protein
LSGSGSIGDGSAASGNSGGKSWLKEIRMACRAFSQKHASGIDPNGRKLFRSRRDIQTKKRRLPEEAAFLFDRDT